MADPILPLGRTIFGNPENIGNVLSKDEAMNLLQEWVQRWVCC